MTGGDQRALVIPFTVADPADVLVGWCDRSAREGRHWSRRGWRTTPSLRNVAWMTHGMSQSLLILLLIFGLASVDSSRNGILRRDGRDLVQWHAHPSLRPGLPPYGSESPLAESFWAIDFKLRFASSASTRAAPSRRHVRHSDTRNPHFHLGRTRRLKQRQGGRVARCAPSQPSPGRTSPERARDLRPPADRVTGPRPAARGLSPARDLRAPTCRGLPAATPLVARSARPRHAAPRREQLRWARSSTRGPLPA